jgi:hypothetical protein
MYKAPQNIFKAFEQRQTELQYTEWLTPDNYYTDNKAIYLFCVIMAFVCQVASGESS